MQSEGEKPVKRPMRGQSMGLRKKPGINEPEFTATRKTASQNLLCGVRLK